MIEVKRRGSKTLTLTTEATATDVNITLTHEFGDSVRAATNAVGAGVDWTYVLTSEDTEACGRIKATWTYKISGVDKKRIDYFKVYQPYTTESALTIDYPEVEGKTDNFAMVERQVRQVVDTYCGQSFDAYPGRTLKIDGSGTNLLHVWYRIESFTNVYIDGDTTNDIAAYCEITPDSEFYLRKKSVRYGSGTKSDEFIRQYTLDTTSDRFFSRKVVYHLKGDFGWGYVPTNIEEATKILMADYYNGDSDHRKHNVIFAGVGPVQSNYKTDLMGTTGNLDADILLMDYTKFIMDYI